MRRALIPALLLAGCGSDLGFAVPDPDTFVVQAFLFAGERVTDVTVYGVLSIDADSSAVAEPISGAQIALTRGGERFELVADTAEPGRYQYAGSDLTIAVGDVFGLEVTHGGLTATAETVVPDPPSGLTLSADSLAAPEFTGGFPGAFDAGLTIGWSNPAQDFFFVVIDNLESDPEPFPDSGFFRGFAPRVVQLPTAADSSVVRSISLTHYGLHRLRLYRINEEYANLYTALRQDSRDLNEPPSNIRGALGIFSAFNADSTFFHVFDAP